MTSEMREMHRKFLAEIRSQKAMLEGQIRELEAVERYHAQQLGEEVSTPESSTTNGHAASRTPPAHLDGATKYEAAQVALRYIGNESRIGELIELLQGWGYGTEHSRKIIHNSLYTAMDRHKHEIFYKTSDGRWGLMEWKREKEGNQEKMQTAQ